MSGSVDTCSYRPASHAGIAIGIFVLIAFGLPAFIFHLPGSMSPTGLTVLAITGLGITGLVMLGRRAREERSEVLSPRSAELSRERFAPFGCRSTRRHRGDTRSLLARLPGAGLVDFVFRSLGDQ